MPELPEVETVKQSLKSRLLGKKIIRTRVLWDNIIAYPSKEEFVKETADKTINDIKRRGKFLMFDLEKYYLLSHLRMEGKYFFKDNSEPILKHEHVIFDLDDTLISEEQYIRSGYHKIAEYILMHYKLQADTEALFQELFALYQADAKNVFNRMLDAHGIAYEKEDILKLVEIYRKENKQQ